MRDKRKNGQEKRIEKKQRRSDKYKNLSYTRGSRKRPVNKKKTRVKSLLGSLFIILILVLIVFLFKKSETETANLYYSNYFNSDFDRAYNNFTSSLFHKKHEKNPETGLYERLNPSSYSIENKITDAFEYYMVDRMDSLFTEYGISQEDLSILIAVKDIEVLSINEDVKHPTYEVDGFIYLLFVDSLIEEGQIDLSQVQGYLDGAYINNSQESMEELISFLSNKGYSINSYKTINLGFENSENYSVRDTLSLIKEYKSRDTYLNNYFNTILKEDDSLFLNAVYANAENQNMLKNNSSIKYDFGIVNGSYPYYYSIYSEKLSEENIHYIGDLINRTISEVSLSRNLNQ